MKISNQTFTNEEINLDDNSYVSCTFDRCRFIFSGVKADMVYCTFIEPQIIFSGAAGVTMMFLASFYKNGGAVFIDRIFDSIRKGAIVNSNAGNADILNENIIE